MSRLEQGMTPLEKGRNFTELSHLNRIELINFLRLPAILFSLVTRIRLRPASAPRRLHDRATRADLASGQ
jgi:hypothetical protein